MWGTFGDLMVNKLIENQEILKNLLNFCFGNFVKPYFQFHVLPKYCCAFFQLSFFGLALPKTERNLARVFCYFIDALFAFYNW